MSQNTMAVCDHVHPVSVLKGTLIEGAISFSERVGQAFLEAKNIGGDYISAVCKASRGKFVAKGIIRSNEWYTEAGYTFGTMEIESDADIYRIWYQNENIIMWKNDAYFCTVPDLICVFNDRDREPQLNPNAEKSCEVSIVALPSPKEWTSKRGLEIFGPRSFAHDVDWVPFCE